MALDGVVARRASIPLARGGVLTTAAYTRSLGNLGSDVNGLLLSRRFFREDRSGQDVDREVGERGRGDVVQSGDDVERRRRVVAGVGADVGHDLGEGNVGGSAGDSSGSRDLPRPSPGVEDGVPGRRVEGAGAETMVEVDL